MYKIDKNVEENAPKLFDKSDEILKEEVERLREWMESQNEVFPEIMNNNMLRNFIIINKFNIEKAKDHIENYYKVRVKYPEFYTNCNPKLEIIKIHMDMFYWVCLPKLTDTMDRVTVCKIGNTALIPKYDLMDYMRLILDAFELRMQVDYMVNNIFVIDNKNVPLSVLMKSTPNTCYKLMKIMEKVYSFRIKKVYFINVPSYALFIFSMLKAIMKKKLYERLYMCADESLLSETFPETMLPIDYGGQEKSLEELLQMQKTYFEENQGRFDRLDEIQEHLMSLNEKDKRNCILS